MEVAPRLFNCVGCHCQVIICRYCDRGNIYCSGQCAQEARKASMRQAGLRYQNTYQGKKKHAARQQRYRQQKQAQKEKVTHQGSNPTSDDTPSTVPPDDAATQSVTYTLPHKMHCDFCKRAVSRYLRMGFLRRGIPKVAYLKSAYPLGP